MQHDGKSVAHVYSIVGGEHGTTAPRLLPRENSIVGGNTVLPRENRTEWSPERKYTIMEDVEFHLFL